MGLSRQRSAQWSFRRSKTTGNELHRLIIRQSWNLAINYIHINPSEAKQWTIRAGFFEGIKASRILPIHQLLCLQPPLELLVELHKAYPDGVKQKETAYGRNPLHIACRGNASFEVIRFLVNAYPTGVQEEDSLGRVPLHYALSADMDEDTIRIILEGFPRGSTASDQRGWLQVSNKLSYVDMSDNGIFYTNDLRNLSYSFSLIAMSYSDPCSLFSWFIAQYNPDAYRGISI